MKSSKKLPNYHWNSFSKSKFYCEKHLCLVLMLFWNVQNQNKQKGVSRFLYLNNNKRLHFFTQISPKSFFKISVFLVKKVKSCNTFIYWEPNNKLGTIPIVSLLNHEQFFWIASLAWTSYGGGKYHSLICYLEFQVRNLFLTKNVTTFSFINQKTYGKGHPEFGSNSDIDEAGDEVFATLDYHSDNADRFFFDWCGSYKSMCTAICVSTG